MNDSRSFAAEALLDGVWAITTDYLRLLWAAAERGVALTGAVASPPAPRQGANGTAVIPIHGPISRRQDFFSMLFGIQSATTSSIANALRAAVADPGVGQIVLHVDSPGGETDGITELAAEIYEARTRKPITAFVDTMAGSAAYWLASQADHIIVTPSGQVGSIGVFALHLDRSGELEQAGIVPTFIQAGKYKTEESPLHPLTDEAKAAVQSRVDLFYSLFTKDVARGRGVPVETVRSQFGEGRMVLAKDAVARGMADVVSDRVTARGVRRIASGAVAATDGDVNVVADSSEEIVSRYTDSPTAAYSYIECHPHTGYADEARAFLSSAALDLGLYGRSVSMRFFRTETERDRLLDTWSERLRTDIAIDGRAYPYANGGRGEIWISSELTRERLREVVDEELRHVAQGEAIHASEALAEADAHAYVTRDRMALVRELHSGETRAS